MRLQKKSKILKCCRIYYIELYYIEIMETYCVSCKEHSVNKNFCFRINKQNRLKILSNCAICVKKKSRFIKNQLAGRLLTNLGITAPLGYISFIDDVLFQ